MASLFSMVRPDKLYKYRVINAFTEDIFLNRRIYCSSPKDFNDPFECRPHWDIFDPDSQEGRERFRTYVHNLGVRKIEQRLRLKRKLRHFYTHPDKQQEIAFQSIAANWGVYSMSEAPSSLLMWPHYADNHCGICLEFRTNFPPFNLSLWPVIYSDVYPTLDLEGKQGVESVLAQLMLTKANEWKYEKEWRLLLRKMHERDFQIVADQPESVRKAYEQQHGPGFYFFPSEALSSVIFGLRTTEKDKMTVFDWIKRGELNPTILYAKQDKSRYRIDLYPSP